MKSYKKLIMIVCFCIATMFIAVNLIVGMRSKNEEDRPYLVEVSRLQKQLAASDCDTEILNLDACEYVKAVSLCENGEDVNASSKNEVLFREINGKLYRFEYIVGHYTSNNLLIINIIMAVVSIFVVLIIAYVFRRIIIPFHKVEEVPYELSKGNLAMELPEEQTKYFGRFVWGTNMLRENLEERRKKELGMHKEKKLLLLSLTHDIKTPLSVIKLNAQALEKNLYNDEERKKQAVQDICAKVDEIEQYVTDIVAAAREDFIDLSVKEEEFYLKSVVDKIRDYYTGKLELQKTDFLIDDYPHVLLSGDENRLGEVIQNLFENAIKYGDGKQIRLSFEEDQGCILLSVRNTGKPMKQEELIKIFDSFYRGSNVSDKDGSGLGLYICRRLMNNMNGDVFAEQTEDEFKVTVVVRMS